MTDSRPSKRRRKDKGEAASREKLDTQLKVMEDKVREMRRNLSSSSKQLPCPLDIVQKFNAVRDSTCELVKITCARAFQEGSEPMLWKMFRRSYMEDLDPAFVQVALESGSVSRNDAVSGILPSEIFDENYDYWMKAVPDSPILLNYLPTTRKFSDFDDDIIWQSPSIRKSRYYWLRQFRSERREKADDRLEEFVEVAKETPSLQTDANVLVAAIELSCRWKMGFDWAVVDPSVRLLEDFWRKTLKATRGFALKHMPFDIQIQHADTVQWSMQFFYCRYTRDSLIPLIARELWSNQLFCIEWMQGMGDLYNKIVPLIPPGAWSDRSFCLALAQQRRKSNKKEPLIPTRTLRPLVAPACWSDRSFCTEWVKHTKDKADELKPLIPKEIWSDKPFCVMRAKYTRGEVNTLFESFPSCRTDRDEFWLSLFSGGGTIYRTEIATFREISKQVPALCEDEELMLAALRRRRDNRTMFGGPLSLKILVSFERHFEFLAAQFWK